MKKLIILGAGVHQTPIIEVAQKMPHVRTIVVDKDPNAPGLKFADDVIIHSIKDHKFLWEEACNILPDGVMAPCADAGLLSAGIIAGGLGLKGPNSWHMIICNDKENFYDFCKLLEINTPELYDDLNEYNFPCIIKPVDGVGSQGVFLIKSFYQKPHPNELLGTAATYSPSKKAMIQQYIKGTVFNVDLLLQDGKILYYILHDEIFEKGKNNFGVDYFVYPSEYASKGFEFPILLECDKLMKALGITDGNIAVEGVVSSVKGINEGGWYEDDVVYIIEVNPRMSGSFHMESHSLASGRNWIEDGINVALGIPVEGGCHPVPHGWVLIGAEEDGFISSIACRSTVIATHRWDIKKIGNYVRRYNGMDSSTDQTVLAYYVESYSKQDVVHRLKKLKQCTTIEVTRP